MYVNDESEGRRSQADRRAATRRALLDAARGLFAERGYHGTVAEEIVRRAGVTRGAMYHHFEDKRGLFRAVVEEIEAEIDELVLVAARTAMEEGGDPLEAWMAGFYAALDFYSRPDVRQIQLVDSSSVLSWEEWHEIDAAHAIAQIESGLELLMDHGVIERQPVGPLAYLLHGATTQGAMYVAFSEDPEQARDEVGGALRRLLEGL
jgi:AcrR family transcriptional regulator